MKKNYPQDLVGWKTLALHYERLLSEAKASIDLAVYSDKSLANRFDRVLKTLEANDIVDLPELGMNY